MQCVIWNKNQWMFVAYINKSSNSRHIKYERFNLLILLLQIWKQLSFEKLHLHSTIKREKLYQCSSDAIQLFCATSKSNFLIIKKPLGAAKFNCSTLENVSENTRKAVWNRLFRTNRINANGKQIPSFPSTCTCRRNIITETTSSSS